MFWQRCHLDPNTLHANTTAEGVNFRLKMGLYLKHTSVYGRTLKSQDINITNQKSDGIAHGESTKT